MSRLVLNRSIPPFAFLLVLAICECSSGQAIPQRSGSARSWPEPVRQNFVRQAQHIQEAPLPSQSTELGTIQDAGFHMDAPLNVLRGSSASQTHRVIVSPDRRPTTASKYRHKHPHMYQPHYWSQHHRPIQPSPAALPRAQQRETWKTPYSYGYFGASGNRHWTLHNGHRDRYTEWRLH